MSAQRPDDWSLNCLGCQYPLRDLTVSHCPECGREIDPNGSRSMSRKDFPGSLADANTGSKVKDFSPTPAQADAIHVVGTSVLVSAGAGSGKTAVLAQRCAQLVAAPRSQCNITNLLVVTFTDAAALQMRQRIGQVLREQLAQSPANRHLQQQLALLETADISTLHSFCRRVLNRYFAQADLDPQAPIMDAQDARLLRQKLAQTVFDQYADRQDATGDAFRDFVATYGGGSEWALVNQALQLDAFLTSIPDAEAWRAATLARFGSAGSPDAALPEFWARLLHDTICAEISEQIQTVEGELNTMAPEGVGVPEARDCLNDYLGVLRFWSRQPLNADWPGLLADYDFPKFKRQPNDFRQWPPEQQQSFTAIKKLIWRIRDDLFKERLKEAYGRFSATQWAEGLAWTQPHIRMYLTLATEIHAAYQQAKRELGVVDFADLEQFTLRLLRDDSAGVAARLRKQYRYVLVDEFQDINPVQAEILRLVSHEGEPGCAGNLFAVGDVKQSIYRFRLAEPQMFLDRSAAFPLYAQVKQKQSLDVPGVAIPLRENFRSEKGVIEVINAVFEKLMSADMGGIDYDENARLVPPPKAEAPPATEQGQGGQAVISPSAASTSVVVTPPPPCPPLELHILHDFGRSNAAADAGQTVETDSQAADEEGDEAEDTADGGAFDWERIQREAYVVAERIHALHAEGAPYGDMVILFRSMQPRAALFLRTLTRLGVPAFADSSGGFFEAMETLDMLSLLALLDNEQQDIPLAALLRSPLMGDPLSDDHLVAIRSAPGPRQAAAPFHAAVRDYAAEGADEGLRNRLASILARLHDWRGRIRRRPLADVLWEIYEESGYLAYVSGLKEGAQRRANLVQLHDQARKFGEFQRQGLHRFMVFLDGLREAGEDLDAGSVVSPSNEVVRVMTIHRSKGLEFPVVFIGELGKKINFSAARGTILFDRRLGVAMKAVDLEHRISYPTLPHRLVAQATEMNDRAEEMRVLYVAMTRAKRRLVMVGTMKLAKLEENRQRFAHWSGVLPILERRTAQSMLDWVAAATCAPSSLYKVYTYDSFQMSHWQTDPPVRPDLSNQLNSCSRMEPLATAMSNHSFAPTQADAAAVAAVLRRLTKPYAAEALTRVPAVVAASVLKRRWEVHQDGESPVATQSPLTSYQPDRISSSFSEPLCLSQVDVPDPTHVGTWTHEFFQRLDLSQPCDLAGLRAQLTEMTQAGVFTDSESAAINIESMVWFFETPLGQRLRSKSTRVLREWPFVLGVNPANYDPAITRRDRDDVMLVRGMVDCLFDDGSSWELLDYKTDAVGGEAMQARAELYRGQLAIYASAVEAVWRKPVRHRWLVFLTARQIVEV